MIRVAVLTDSDAKPIALTAPSIGAALELAGGNATGARLVFPINPAAFFVEAVNPTASPGLRAAARPRRGAAR